MERKKGNRAREAGGWDGMGMDTHPSDSEHLKKFSRASRDCDDVSNPVEREFAFGTTVTPFGHVTFPEISHIAES